MHKPTYYLYTTSGQPVFSLSSGKGYWLEKSGTMEPTRSIDFGDGATQREKRRQKAETKLGVPLEWRLGKPTEIMYL